MRRNPTPKPGTLVKFVPQSFGNAEDPQPVTVYLRAPSEADKRDALVVLVGQAEAGPGAKDAVKVKTDQGEVTIGFSQEIEKKGCRLARWVERVENYADSDGEPIATGADLWERGEYGFALEVDEAIGILMGLSVEERKNSAGSSASSQAATQASGGTASNVSPTASTGPATATVGGQASSM